MAKGIIYIMTTAVPGLIKIGKTGSQNFEQRMYDLEHDGYRNVTALKRSFAIEVDEYDAKESLLQAIFEKSRLANTELFALNADVAIQLLSSFEGKVVFPTNETKEEIFEYATDKNNGKCIPNGVYKFRKKKKSDNKTVIATAVVENGRWILQSGSILGMVEDAGVSQRARIVRASLPIDLTGKLLENVDLGECSPSHAGTVVMNQSNNGWSDWKNSENQPVDIYRRTKEDD